MRKFDRVKVLFIMKQKSVIKRCQIIKPNLLLLIQFISYPIVHSTSVATEIPEGQAHM